LHIITRKKLLAAADIETKLGKALDAWYRAAKKAEWTSLVDVRKTYPDADGVTVGKAGKKRAYTVFNICGNDFRLITEIYYEDNTILVRDVLTHAEYDQGRWKR
jgi:mRNA interferase HigB